MRIQIKQTVKQTVCVTVTLSALTSCQTMINGQIPNTSPASSGTTVNIQNNPNQSNQNTNSNQQGQTPASATPSPSPTASDYWPTPSPSANFPIYSPTPNPWPIPVQTSNPSPDPIQTPQSTPTPTSSPAPVESTDPIPNPTPTPTATPTAVPINQAPSGSLSALANAQTLRDGQTTEIVLQASGSDPEDGQNVSYALFDENGNRIANSSQATLTRGAGNYTFAVEITDSQGASQRYQATVTINSQANQAPIIQSVNLADAFDAGLNGMASIQGQINANDPDADNLTFEVRKDGQVLSNQQNFNFTLPAGTHPLEFIARDSYGLEARQNKSITVNQLNQNPTANISGQNNLIKQVGQAVSSVYTATASDPNGDSVSLEWFLNGNRIGSGTSVTAVFNQYGNQEIKVVATDNKGGRTEKSMTVQVKEQYTEISYQINNSESTNGASYWGNNILRGAVSKRGNSLVDFTVSKLDGGLFSETQDFYVQVGDPNSWGYKSVIGTVSKNKHSATLSLDLSTIADNWSPYKDYYLRLYNPATGTWAWCGALRITRVEQVKYRY